MNAEAPTRPSADMTSVLRETARVVPSIPSVHGGRFICDHGHAVLEGSPQTSGTGSEAGYLGFFDLGPELRVSQVRNGVIALDPEHARIVASYLIAWADQVSGSRP